MVAEAKEYRETVATEKDSNKEFIVHDPDPEVSKTLASSKTSAPINYGIQTPKPSTTENIPNTVEPTTDEINEKDLENMVPCPLCEKDLYMNSLVEGTNTCPHCQGTFEASM